jgi:plasmid stabilization system protein ParE
VTIIWSPQARQDADEAADYIARDRSGAAYDWLVGLHEAVSRLEEYPESGRVLTLLAQPAVRELIYNSYRVIYRIAASDEVRVLRVWHVRRRLRNRDIDAKPAS